jgi:hypothetical protein
MPDSQSLYVRGTCAVLLITCSDFRFKTAERALAESAGLTDDYDLIARPGAIRELVAPRSPAGRETLEDEIALLWRLHRFSRVLMVQHMTCGAYGDLAQGEAQRALHLAHLQAAAGAVARLCGGAATEGFLLDVDGGEARAERVC